MTSHELSRAFSRYDVIPGHWMVCGDEDCGTRMYLSGTTAWYVPRQVAGVSEIPHQAFMCPDIVSDELWLVNGNKNWNTNQTTCKDRRM